MLEFRDIILEDITKIENIVYHSNIISSLYSSYNLYALRKKYNTRIAIVDKGIYLSQTSRSIKEEREYLYPLGEIPLDKIIKDLKENNKDKNSKLSLWGVSYNIVKKINEELPNKFIIEEIKDWADYIYQKDNLLSSKIIKKGNKFIDLYKNRYKVEEISMDNINEIINFQYIWMQNNYCYNQKPESLKFENNSIIDILSSWNKFNLKGYCIKLDGIVVGYIYGLLQTYNCFVIHVIKTDKSIKGLTIFLIKYLVENINIEYINFEEDIGIEGLRTFKTRLGPLYMLKKYKAIEI